AFGSVLEAENPHIVELALIWREREPLERQLMGSFRRRVDEDRLDLVTLTLPHGCGLVVVRGDRQLAADHEGGAVFPGIGARTDLDLEPDGRGSQLPPDRFQIRVEHRATLGFGHWLEGTTPSIMTSGSSSLNRLVR